LIGLGSLTGAPKAKSTNAAPAAPDQNRLYRNLIYFSLGLLVVVGMATVVLSKGRKH
jgi:hypothetical protein